MNKYKPGADPSRPNHQFLRPRITTTITDRPVTTFITITITVITVMIMSIRVV